MPDFDLIEFENIYTPGTLLGVYANALRTPADGKMIIARGILQILGNQNNYGGYYYDNLKSIDENRVIRTKISAQMRSTLTTESVYVFKGYIEKRINFSNIELILSVNEVLRKEENAINEEDVKRFEKLQKKITAGFRDLEALVKEHIYNQRKLRIVNLYGTTAIVHRDFDLGIAESKVKFDITEHRCNFSSKAELITAI